MTSMIGNNVLHNNPPVHSDQRRAVPSEQFMENIAPPSYEEAINPNGRY